MTDSVAVAGDGVLTIPATVSGVIAMDISANYGSLLMNESAASIQLSNNLARQQSQIANGVLQANTVKDSAEVGLIEGKTAGNIFATPSASPVNKV